jgi:hypothetical protein
MDLWVFAAGISVRSVLCDWFSRAKDKLPSKQRAVPSATQFPQVVEVITGKLKVKVFLHEVRAGNEVIPCWTYLTDGLLTHRQKEIMFTLRRDSGQMPEDYPREFFRLFADFFWFAEQGHLVDVGDSTLFGEEGFYGRKEFRGIGYIEPESLPGVETGESPLLAGILLKNDEAMIAWRLGLTRVVALLGKHFRCYPCPPWSDLNRRPMASLASMENSILEEAARVRVRSCFYHQDNSISLRLFPVSRERLQKFLAQVGPSTPLALRTQVDPRANACLVWPESKTSRKWAITPPNSDGSRKTGAFVLFIPEQSSNKIRIVEDGVAVFLTNNDWKTIREALQSSSDILIPMTGQDGGTFSLEWSKPGALYTSRVTGETVILEAYPPHPTSAPPKLSVSVSAAQIVLLSSDRHLRERTTAEDVAGYVNKIGNVVEKFFAFSHRMTQREVAVHIALMQNGSTIRFVATPDLTPEDTQEFQAHLESVRAPKVTGLVKVEYLASLWKPAVRQ